MTEKLKLSNENIAQVSGLAVRILEKFIPHFKLHRTAFVLYSLHARKYKSRPYLIGFKHTILFTNSAMKI